MAEITPGDVLKAAAQAVPVDCLANIIVIGSLAAGYHFFGENRDMQIRTKDVDCVLNPRVEAMNVGKNIAESLLQAGWEPKFADGMSGPGTAETPDEKLPAIRLFPPESKSWFIELLTVPETEDQRGREWTRVVLPIGHFGIPTFSFLSFTAYHPHDTPHGIRYARPEMMALANLLEHPEIKPAAIGELFEGRKIKRSNKDLGRVLAIARLSHDSDLQLWPGKWEEALQECFPSQCRQLRKAAGSGLRALIASEVDLEQAVWACNNGLLASKPVTMEQLEFTARRLLQDVLEPFEAGEI